MTSWGKEKTMSEFTKVAAKSEIAPGYTKKVEIKLK